MPPGPGDGRGSAEHLPDAQESFWHEFSGGLDKYHSLGLESHQTLKRQGLLVVRLIAQPDPPMVSQLADECLSGAGVKSTDASLRTS